MLWEERRLALRSKDVCLSKSLCKVLEVRRRISRCFESSVWAIYIVVGFIGDVWKMVWILLLFVALGLDGVWLVL